MPDRPNILIITTDQQSHHLMSCAGNPWLSTPNMDRIASWGTRLTRAYTPNPVCLPARYSWWTGRMPSSIGIRHNGSPVGSIPATVRDGGLGKLLRGAGYDCRFGGKQHLPGDLDAAGLGFSVYEHDDRDRLARATADLLRQGCDRPWCKAVNFVNPHDICYLAIRAHAGDEQDRRLLTHARVQLQELDAALATFDPDRCPPLPDNFAIAEDEPAAIGWLVDERDFKRGARDRWTREDWRRHRWAYLRLTERVDGQVGIVLDALEASGQLEDTVIIFTSDHGDHDASHRLEHKTTFYDEAVRVPLLVARPGHGPAGAVDEGWFSNTGLDLMATCCDYAGIDRPDFNRGRSLRPVIEGTPVEDLPAGAYAESQLGTMWVTRDHKYCRYDIAGDEEVLYDLAADPGEMRNCATDAGKAAVLTEHRAALDVEVAAERSLRPA